MFDQLQAALVDALILAIPDLTKNALFIIETDASDILTFTRLWFRTVASYLLLQKVIFCIA